MYKPKKRHWKSTLHVSVISLPFPNLTLLKIIQWKLLQCKWKVSILITMNLVSHPHRHSKNFVAQSILTNVCFRLWLMDQSESVLQLLVNLTVVVIKGTTQDKINGIKPLAIIWIWSVWGYFENKLAKKIHLKYELTIGKLIHLIGFNLWILQVKQQPFKVSLSCLYESLR